MSRLIDGGPLGAILLIHPSFSQFWLARSEFQESIISDASKIANSHEETEDIKGYIVNTTTT